MHYQQKKDNLILSLREIERNVDFACKVPEMDIEYLIKTDPLFSAALNQALRVDEFGVGEFLLTVLKLVTSERNKYKQAHREVIENGIPSIVIQLDKNAEYPFFNKPHSTQK